MSFLTLKASAFTALRVSWTRASFRLNSTWRSSMSSDFAIFSCSCSTICLASFSCSIMSFSSCFLLSASSFSNSYNFFNAFFSRPDLSLSILAISSSRSFLIFWRSSAMDPWVFLIYVYVLSSSSYFFSKSLRARLSFWMCYSKYSTARWAEWSSWICKSCKIRCINWSSLRLSRMSSSMKRGRLCFGYCLCFGCYLYLYGGLAPLS